MAQRVLSDATNSGARYRSTASSGKAAGGAPTVTFAAAAEARYPESLLPTRSSRRFSLSDFTIPRKGGHIGSGRFGQVLRVTENSSKRALVLKRVSKQALVDEGAVRQFQREVEIHCRVRHPNIIRMFAYFHDAESCMLARLWVN
jgi:serine/threonine protein kinase